jgi:RNA polymerase sigma-70 factor (ECF subfamily)
VSASAVELAIWLSAAPAAPEEKGEAEFVARARQGDPSAFEEIVRRHQTRVYNLAYRMLRHREEAEDVTQEAFLKAFTALPALREPGALGAWLERITATLCLGRLRSPRRREVTTGNPTPQEVDTETEELSRAVREAVAQLPAHYRLAIVCFYLEGRSYEEAARVAGVGVRTLKTRLYRARVQLRARLGEALGEVEEWR